MILLRAWLRHLSRQPLLSLLGVLGVALGVAVAVSIDLANGSALQSFRHSVRAVSGRATHQIVGSPGGLPDAVYATLRSGPGIRSSAPVVEGYAALPGRPGTAIHLVGIDPFSDLPFRDYAPGSADGTLLGRFLTLPGAVLASPETAADWNLAPGASITVRAAGRDSTLHLLGFLAPADEASRAGLRGVAVIDIASAQEILGRPGRLSRIDLILPEGQEGAEALRRLAGSLPPGASILPSNSRAGSLEGMTRAFSLNLTALSLLALVVGMFLVYNTVSFSVLRRRELLGILRALGATRGQVYALVLGEAAWTGCAGTAVGLPGGIALGQGLLSLVSRTVGDLYFALPHAPLLVPASSLAKGAALGIAAPLLCALRPAHEAAGTAPRIAMTRSAAEQRAGRIAPVAALGGLAMAAAGAAGLALPGRGVAWGFSFLFAGIAGYALAVPFLTGALARAMRRPLGFLFGTPGRMAARGVEASLSRTGVAVAALAVAVSSTVGIGIMIGSFRQTLLGWLDRSLRADLYVVSSSREGRLGRAPLPPSLVETLRADPALGRVTTGRRVYLEDPGGVTELFVVDQAREDFEGFRLKSGDPATAWKAFREGEAVMVSEPFSWHRELRSGDPVSLRTERGEHRFPVAGIYADYASDRGTVAMHRATYDRFYPDRSVDSLAIRLPPGSDPDEAARKVRASAGEAGDVAVRTNRGLREASVTVFERTFAVTGVLRWLALVVASAGTLGALMSIALERSREFALLRAIGATPGQLRGTVLSGSAAMGIIAGILALPLGIAQALALILVINRRSFGWSMEVHLETGILLEGLAVAAGAALLAGVYPSLRLSRRMPAEGLREE